LTAAPIQRNPIEMIGEPFDMSIFKMYEIVKEFAGPVATIIASITAAFLTWRFAPWQARIAQQQADTPRSRG